MFWSLQRHTRRDGFDGMSDLVVLAFGLLSIWPIMGAVGLWTVSPPEEDGLCTDKGLGLFGRDADQREWALRGCHRLYDKVFNLRRIMSIPFSLAGLVAFASALNLRKTHYLRRDLAAKAAQYLCFMSLLDVVGMLTVVIPVLLFPGVDEVVSEALVPIRSYLFLQSYAKAASRLGPNAIPFLAAQGIRPALLINNTFNGSFELSTTTYAGYTSARHVGLCIELCRFSLIALLHVYIFNFARNLMTATCGRNGILYGLRDRYDARQAMLRDGINREQQEAAVDDVEQPPNTGMDQEPLQSAVATAPDTEWSFAALFAVATEADALTSASE